MRNLLILTTLFSLSAQLFASDYKAVAYMPTYRMSHINQMNYDLITHVMASFINPDEQGYVSWEGADIDFFVQSVHANNALACISIGGGGDYSWGDKVYIYENLLATGASRTAFIHKLMNYVRDHDIDGIDNDLEGQALALANFNVFTQELADSCHAANVEITSAIGVGGNWGENLYDDATLAKMDFIMTMSYGGVGQWNWQSKKDEHTYASMVSDMEHFTITRGLPKEKVLGGIPFYTVEFPSSAQSSYGSYMKTLCQTISDSQYAGQDPLDSDTLYTTEGHPVYLNSFRTIKRKMDYCKTYGGGIMIWEIGQDCYSGSFSMQDSMYSHLTSGNLAVPQIATSSKIVLSPNPAKDSVLLSASCAWELRELSGAPIKSGFGQIISLEELAAGTYIINACGQSQKLVKQ